MVTRFTVRLSLAFRVESPASIADTEISERGGIEIYVLVSVTPRGCRVVRPSQSYPIRVPRLVLFPVPITGFGVV